MGCNYYRYLILYDVTNKYQIYEIDMEREYLDTGADTEMYEVPDYNWRNETAILIAFNEYITSIVLNRIKIDEDNKILREKQKDARKTVSNIDGAISVLKDVDESVLQLLLREKDKFTSIINLKPQEYQEEIPSSIVVMRTERER